MNEIMGKGYVVLAGHLVWSLSEGPNGLLVLAGSRSGRTETELIISTPIRNGKRERIEIMQVITDPAGNDFEVPVADFRGDHNRPEE